MTDSLYKSRWQDAEALRPLAILTVIVCGSWWMLGQLAVVLRPLLVAIVLGYVLLPWFTRLRKSMPGPVALVSLAGIVALALAIMAVVTYSSLLSVQDEFPKIERRAVAVAQHCGAFVQKHVPWLVPAAPEGEDGKDRRPEIVFAERATELAKVEAGRAAAVAASGMSEGVIAGLYLFFLLLEASRFPERVKGAYDTKRADQILTVFNRINAAVNGYLRAKVLSGLYLAIACAIAMWLFGVRFVFLWAVFSFLCNFIPYVGTLLAYGLPTAFALLVLDNPTTAITFAIVLLGVHVFMGTIVEPYLLGKAVGLSPLVILVALALWGSIWGLPGMFLAVPLTMVVLIVLDNIPSTRSFARLLLT